MKLVEFAFAFFAVMLVPSGSPAAEPSRAPDFSQLRLLLRAAKERAPEVSIANASLTSSRSARESARVTAFGNPYVELTAERGGGNVTQDIAVNGALWLPVELSGQRGSRRREAEAFVSLNAALVEQVRARAAARLVRAYGAAVVAVRRSAVLQTLLKDARAEAELMTERLKRGDAVRSDASLAVEEAARHEVMIAENGAELARARGELEELTGSVSPAMLGPATPPTLEVDSSRQANVGTTPLSRSLVAEATFYASSADRWRREGQSMLSFGVTAGRGDYGEARLGGGLAYAFPVFRSNRPEVARAAAESTRALAEKSIQETLALHRLRFLLREQRQLARALLVLTTVALPAAEDAVRAVRETYAAGKAELLAVLFSRRELASLALRRLDLVERSWRLVADYVQITGALP